MPDRCVSDTFEAVVLGAFIFFLLFFGSPL